MEELVNLLKEFFSKSYKSYDKAEIKKKLNVKGEKQEKILSNALNLLVEEGVLFYDKKGYRQFPKQDGYAFGKLQINKSGTGFVHTNDGHTILIENSDLNGALDGDNVIVNNIFSKRKDYYHGKIYKITKRKNGNLIFEVIKTGDIVSLIPYNSLNSIPVSINLNKFNNLIDGDLLLVNIGCEFDYGVYEGTILKRLGHKDDPNIEIKIILEKHNIPTEFSDKVLNEAMMIPKSVTLKDIENRVDLRNETIFTIDCDNTKDRDDSVGIKKLSNGNYLLKVNIAHVSHYIKKNSEIFKEALNRTMSLYPGNTCIPMLPRVISNGICSLNPNEDRLTRTIEMEIDINGNIVNYNIYNSVINSKIAMSYSDVNKVLNGEYIPEYEPYKEDLKLLEQLNIILENARNNRNYINFNTSEVEVSTEKSGEMHFHPNNSGVAGQIIENCMIIANATVYNYFSWNVLAYRVHESPNEERVKEIIEILRASGIKIPKINNIDNISLRKIIEGLDKNEITQIITEYLLKSMKKARYDTTNLGHFALQYDIYGHFTSPIRRIIDLITHMTIDNIENFDYSEKSINEFESFLTGICKKTNEIEKESMSIEDEVMDMLMAKEMSKHIGEKFEVYITDINSYSMLVRTKNLVRGKIKLASMADDKYYYDFDKKAIMGKKSKKKYQIGNKLIVLLKEASKEFGTIYFEISNEKVLKKIS